MNGEHPNTREAPTTDPNTCLCCSNRLCFQWSDSHGIGVCTTCGMPYRLFHYENNERVDRAPSVCLDDEGVEIAKRYWAETHRRVFPACFDMGMSRSGRSYSGATEDDCIVFDEWYKANGYAKAEESASE